MTRSIANVNADQHAGGDFVIGAAQSGVELRLTGQGSMAQSGPYGVRHCRQLGARAMANDKKGARRDSPDYPFRFIPEKF